jgi:hypothetical protein
LLDALTHAAILDSPAAAVAPSISMSSRSTAPVVTAIWRAKLAKLPVSKATALAR